MSYAKFIGGALGWALGGPIGALLGFAFGYMMDDKSFSLDMGKGQGRIPGGGEPQYEQFRHHTRPGDFGSALLVLSAAVMKADQKLLKSELDFIRAFYARQFGSTNAAYQVGLLKELLKKEIPLRDVCQQIRHFMELPMRLQLLHYLFGIARADGNVDKAEVHIIGTIANYLGISDKDYESIRAMFYKDAASAFKILEIESNATDDEVKKAYRKMAMKYHPDKVRGLGEQHEKAAQAKFIKVQQAYEQLKKERGFK
ncbi:MAG: TerB family tellurite resistance protein [Flavobacteriales bacterium]|nr:TerB family tellurite resistance protein [Flavobacteriales bacterium]